MNDSAAARSRRSFFREADGQLRRDVVRWFWTHPHVVVWRLLMWVVWKPTAIRHLRFSTLMWINPAPLRMP